MLRCGAYKLSIKGDPPQQFGSVKKMSEEQHVLLIQSHNVQVQAGTICCRVITTTYICA